MKTFLPLALLALGCASPPGDVGSRALDETTYPKPHVRAVLFDSRCGWLKPTPSESVYDNASPDTETGRGEHVIDGEVLRVRRLNTKGRYVLAWDRSLVQRLPEGAPKQRLIRFRYEAMASQGGQRLQLIVKRESEGDWNWLVQQPEQDVSATQWPDAPAEFVAKIDSGETWYFRIDSVGASAPGAYVAIRRLLVEDITP